MYKRPPTENVGKSLSNEEEDEELQPLTVQKHLLFNLLFYSSNKNGIPGNLSFKTTSESLVLNNPLWLKRSGIPYLHVIA